MTDEEKRIRIKGILGLGCDNADGHTRLTQGENFTVYDGSEITHEQLQEICVKINRLLDEEGVRLEDLTQEEFIALLGRLDTSE